MSDSETTGNTLLVKLVIRGQGTMTPRPPHDDQPKPENQET